MGDRVIFSGSANIALSREICKHLDQPLGEAKISTFSDGEKQIEIKDNVRQRNVFVIQPTCAPTDINLVELLLMIDAFKRSSASRITAVIPYFGYARQDKKVAPRVPLSAKLVADLLQTAGATRIITMDLHAGQIQGFFNVPVDNLYAMPLIEDYIEKTMSGNLVMVSPDAGGVERARALAKRIHADLAIIDKRRDAPNRAEAMNVLGDVSGKDAFIIDDIIDTAGTLTEAATALAEKDANKIYAIATHPVLSGKSISILNSSPIEKVIVTNTIPSEEKRKQCSKIEVISVAGLIAEAIRRSHIGDSVTSLFRNYK